MPSGRSTLPCRWGSWTGKRTGGHTRAPKPTYQYRKGPARKCKRPTTLLERQWKGHSPVLGIGWRDRKWPPEKWNLSQHSTGPLPPTAQSSGREWHREFAWWWSRGSGNHCHSRQASCHFRSSGPGCPSRETIVTSRKEIAAEYPLGIQIMSWRTRKLRSWG